jgi:hypothetical protein
LDVGLFFAANCGVDGDWIQVIQVVLFMIFEGETDNAFEEGWCGFDAERFKSFNLLPCLCLLRGIIG